MVTAAGAGELREAALSWRAAEVDGRVRPGWLAGGRQVRRACLCVCLPVCLYACLPYSEAMVLR